MKIIKTIILSLSMLFSVQTLAADKGVAKVLVAKGKAYNVNTKKKLKKGEWIHEGTKILTKSKSFVKLLFIDKSKMSLGPNSQMLVEKFPKKDAGIINLIKGQLRSKVTKNYLEMKDKNKSKLFIKTKTAAMGVRGTDFQVNYNPINKNTSLLTFEGAVAMGALKDLKGKLSQRSLERVVSSTKAVMVRRGQFSGVIPKMASSAPMEPVKVNSRQLKAMEKNDGSKFDEPQSSTNKPKKKVKTAMRSVVPPGVQSTEFAGASKKEMMEKISAVDTTTAKVIKEEIKQKAPEAKKVITASESKPAMRDGGLIDMKTVQYIPPPANAAVDPMTNETIIPVHFGYVDPATGAYKNDVYELKDDGGWEALPVAKNDVGSGDSRSPASTDSKDSNAPTAAALPPPPPKMEDIYVADQEAPVVDRDVTQVNDTDLSKVLDERDQVIEQTNEAIENQKSRVRFNLNVVD